MKRDSAQMEKEEDCILNESLVSVDQSVFERLNFL